MLPLAKQNAFRSRYARLRPGWRGSGPELEAAIRATLTPHSRVLDLGCGRGGVMELFCDEVALAVGLDPDRRSLAEHRASMPLACGVGEALPFQTAAFDLVIGLWILEHLPAPEAVLGEVRRSLRPGGRFVFLTPNALHPLVWANRASQWLPAIQRRLVPTLYGRSEADTFHVHYRANTPAHLRALAARCGFRMARLQAIPDPTYLAFNEPMFRLSLWLERLLPPGWGVHLLGEWVTEM